MGAFIVAIREIINRHAWLATAGVVIVTGFATFMVLRTSRNPASAAPGASGMSFYTIDDGATWFPDRTDLLPPFKKDGKDAVRAYVYRGPDGVEFVSHLERYTAEARRTLATFSNLPPEQQSLEDPSSLSGGLDGIEVKRPTDKAWVRASQPGGQQIMQPRSPAGKTDGLQFVEPG
jgi:hypothetical protein